MRSASLALLVPLAAASLGAATGSAAPATALRVPATADVFAAGLAAPPSLPGGGGTLPPTVRFAAGPGKVLTFTRVTGQMNSGFGSPQFGPAGDTTRATNELALGGISGIVAPGWLFLAGVFLGDGAPGPRAPPRLRMENAARLATVSPQLQHVFYVGDGRTRSGAVRVYNVPANATHLYLGFVDAIGIAKNPSSYGDNAGSVTATFRIARRSR